MEWEVLAKSVLGQLERAVEFWSPRIRCVLLPFLDVSPALSQCLLQRLNERLEVRTEWSEPAEETYHVFKPANAIWHSFIVGALEQSI